MRRLAAVAAAGMLLATCGGTPGPRPTGADAVVLRVASRGGFAAESHLPARLPQLSVFGDGRVVTLGPRTLEYPGPALPNLQELRVTGKGLQRIVDEARAAGLLDDTPPDYGDPGVTDQPTTIVTIHADAVSRRVEVYALGFRGRVSGVTPEQMENRRRLEQFIERSGDAGSFGDDVVPGSERRYEPGALAVLVRPSDSTDGDGHAWPLGDLAGTDCMVLTGDDAATASAAARGTNDGDAWEWAGTTYRVTFRPLLPDECSCEQLR